MAGLGMLLTVTSGVAWTIVYIVLLNMKIHHVGAVSHTPGDCALTA